MPSLFRFIFIALALAGLVGGGLYVLSEYYSPEARETRSVVNGVKIRR